MVARREKDVRCGGEGDLRASIGGFIRVDSLLRRRMPSVYSAYVG